MGLPLDLDARAGYGRFLFQNDTHALEAHVGLGYAHSAFDTGDTWTGPAAGAGLEYALHIFPGLTLAQKLTAESNLLDSEDWEFHSFTELSRKISRKISIFVGYWFTKWTLPVEDFPDEDHRVLAGVDFNY
jgi:putative salt-induced outer membrane protein YdiY